MSLCNLQRLCALLLICSGCAEIGPNASLSDADTHNRHAFHKDVAWNGSEVVAGEDQAYRGSLAGDPDIDIWHIRALSDANLITLSAWAEARPGGKCVYLWMLKCSVPGVGLNTCPVSAAVSHIVAWPLCGGAVQTYPLPFAVAKDEVIGISLTSSLEHFEEWSRTDYVFVLSAP